MEVFLPGNCCTDPKTVSNPRYGFVMGFTRHIEWVISISTAASW